MSGAMRVEIRTQTLRAFKEELTKLVTGLQDERKEEIQSNSQVPH